MRLPTFAVMDSRDKVGATCPACGLQADRHTELIPVERRILNDRGGVVTIDGLISEKHYDYSEREALLCPNGHSFPIPDGLARDNCSAGHPRSWPLIPARR